MTFFWEFYICILKYCVIFYRDFIGSDQKYQILQKSIFSFNLETLCWVVRL